jgi:hypothetical protein
MRLFMPIQPMRQPSASLSPANSSRSRKPPLILAKPPHAARGIHPTAAPECGTCGQNRAELWPQFSSEREAILAGVVGLGAFALTRTQAAATWPSRLHFSRQRRKNGSGTVSSSCSALPPMNCSRPFGCGS